MDASTLKTLIRTAFASVEYPGDRCLRGSNEGNEPFEVEQAFAGKRDRDIIDPTFLDQQSTALCFFSDEAFRYFLPAYMIADVDDRLVDVSVAFHLCHGLGDLAKSERVNPRRYGERTWFESARHKFAVFDRAQAAAIVSFLEFKLERDECMRTEIEEALRNYWHLRSAGAPV